MTIGIDEVEVEFCRSSRDWRQTAVMVKVRSRRRRGLKTTVEVDTRGVESSSKLIQKIGIAAAACAEDLGKKYGDNIDPESAASKAIRAFAEECRLYAEVNKDAGSLVKRLHSQRQQLPDAARALVDRWFWIMNQATGKMTPADVRMAQSLTAILHKH